MEYDFEDPNWKPLEERIGHFCSNWMWMYRRNGLEYYKNIDTRRYLVLDQGGQCYGAMTGFEPYTLQPIDFEAAYDWATDTPSGWGLS